MTIIDTETGLKKFAPVLVQPQGTVAAGYAHVRIVKAKSTFGFDRAACFIVDNTFSLQLLGTALSLRVAEQGECTVGITFRQVADQVSGSLPRVSLELKIEVPGWRRWANGPGRNRRVWIDVRGYAFTFSMESHSYRCKAGDK
jgi:hypothetical protein